jgi:hypothetical protein
MTKGLDGGTDARYFATYTIGKGEAMDVCKPCRRSCVEGQGPRTTYYHQ